MMVRSRILTLIGISVLGLGSTMAFSGCTRSANLTVVNRSKVELTNVVAAGTGFTQSIGSIPAGQQHSISVNPTSESGLKLDFDAKGKRFTSAPQGYFEGGSSTKITAIVAPDLTVTVETNK